jgi:hypothetical protein
VPALLSEEAVDVLTVFDAACGDAEHASAAARLSLGEVIAQAARLEAALEARRAALAAATERRA